MEYECPNCDVSFEVNFTDEVIGESPDVKFCPNCGCNTIYDK